MDVIVFSTKKCPNCETLKKWLKSHKMRFKEKDMSEPEIMSELIMKEVYSLSTPVLQVNDKFLLPNDMFKENKLDEKLLEDNLGVKNESKRD
jgi:glutaredoxin